MKKLVVVSRSIFFGLLICMIAFNAYGGEYVCPNPDSESSVALFVDQTFYEPLEMEIHRLADDIATDLSACPVVTVIDTDQITPENIRAAIKDLYENNGLLGSVLIGDIPTAYWGDYDSYPPIATDAFYEDLDDQTWVDPDANGIYNIVADKDGDGEYDWFYKTWIGEHNREVWCGRLLPPRSVSYPDRVDLLGNYLDRNHEFRVGGMVYQRGMVYAESLKHNGYDGDGGDDYGTVYNRAVLMMDESWLFDRQSGDTLNFVWSDDLYEHMNLWLTGVHESYEYGFLSVHGSANGQWFGSSNWLYSSDYQGTPSGTLLIELASCNNGAFTSSDYLGGWVLFAGDALAVLANTTSVMYTGDPRPNPDHRLLSLGLTLGEIRFTDVLSNDSSVLLGDPTLRIREPEDGPRVSVDKDIVIFPDESASNLSKGYTGERSITIINDGNESVSIYYRINSLTSIDGGRPWGNDFGSHFEVKNRSQVFPIDLTPGESQSIDMDFYYDGHSGLGVYRAKFLLYTDTSTTPYLWIGMQKKLRSPDIDVSPLEYDFGEVPAGSSSTPLGITVANVGDEDLSLGTLTINGANASEFSIQNDNCSNQILAPSEICTVDVVFSPVTEGAKSASLSIPSNDPDTPTLEVPLTGEGEISTVPAVEITDAYTTNYCGDEFDVFGILDPIGFYAECKVSGDAAKTYKVVIIVKAKSLGEKIVKRYKDVNDGDTVIFQEFRLIGNDDPLRSHTVKFIAKLKKDGLLDKDIRRYPITVQ